MFAERFWPDRFFPVRFWAHLGVPAVPSDGYDAMTLSELEQDCYRRLGFATASPDTTTQTRVRAYLNETQVELLSEPGAETLLYNEVSFASVASQPTYNLPPVVARVRSILDTTNLIALTPGSESWWHAVYPDPDALTGIPTRWVDLGISAVSVQPTAACELFAISTSATDTGATHTVYVEGYRTGGLYCAKSVALNGVTGVSLSAAVTDWIQVTKFYTSTDAAVGDITLRMTTGAGTLLATIGIGLTTPPQFRQIALAICPSGVVTYTVAFVRDLTDMSIATDTPLLPRRFHRLLAIGARRKEYEKMAHADRYAAATVEYLSGLRKYKYFLASQAVGTPNLCGLGTEKPSQLGPWYGAGT